MVGGATGFPKLELRKMVIDKYIKVIEFSVLIKRILLLPVISYEIRFKITFILFVRDFMITDFPSFSPCNIFGCHFKCF